MNTILCALTRCLGFPHYPVIARTIAQYNVCPRPSVIAIYTIQYWQLQYLVKAKLAYTILSLPRLYAEWQHRGGGGGVINCPILIEQYNGGVAIKEMLNANNNIGNFTIPE